jgi:hypothetical protein
MNKKNNNTTITPEEARKTAAKVNQLIGADIPDYLRNAIIGALWEAAGRAHVSENITEKSGNADYVDFFTRLFTATGLNFLPTSSEEIAYHVSAILKHPDTPVRLYNAIATETTEMAEAVDFETPDMVARTLDAYQTKHGSEPIN